MVQIEELLAGELLEAVGTVVVELGEELLDEELLVAAGTVEVELGG